MKYFSFHPKPLGPPRRDPDGVWNKLKYKCIYTLIINILIDSSLSPTIQSHDSIKPCKLIWAKADQYRKYVAEICYKKLKDIYNNSGILTEKLLLCEDCFHFLWSSSKSGADKLINSKPSEPKMYFIYNFIISDNGNIPYTITVSKK